MADVEFFTVKAKLQAFVADYTDADSMPDVQLISSTWEFIARRPDGALAWAPGLTTPAGIALPVVKARTDTDGLLRSIHLSPINEIQQIALTGSSATVAFNGSATVNITNTMTNLQVKAALESLSTIGAGNVGVSGSTGTYVVTFANLLGNQNVPTMTATGATITVTRQGASNDGVELVANTSVLDIDELIYDCRLTNVIYNRSVQRLDSFAFVAPTTGGVTLDMASVPKLDPKPGI